MRVFTEVTLITISKVGVEGIYRLIKRNTTKY